MIHTEKKFAYRHKPTGKWVYIDVYFDDELWHDDKHPYVYEMELVEHFANASIEPKKFIAFKLKKVSTMNGEKYAAQNFEDFDGRKILKDKYRLTHYILSYFNSK